MSYERSPRVVVSTTVGTRVIASPPLLGGTKPMRRRAGSAWFMARKAPNCATVRSDAASSPEVTARSCRRGSDGHAGSCCGHAPSRRPRSAYTARDRNSERVRDRDQQVRGDVLETALHLGQVGGRASGLPGDLAEAPSLALAMSAKHAAPSSRRISSAVTLRAEFTTLRAYHRTVRAGAGGRAERRRRYPLVAMATLLSVNLGHREGDARTPTPASPASTSGLRPTRWNFAIRVLQHGRSGCPGDAIGDPRVPWRDRPGGLRVCPRGPRRLAGGARPPARPTASSART